MLDQALAPAPAVLTKGGNATLHPRGHAGRFQAAVRWHDPDGATDIDVSALLLGPDGRVRSDADFVFYNAPTGGDGAVRLRGRRADDDSAEVGIVVDLEALPAGVATVVIAASIDPDSATGSFGEVRGLGLTFTDGDGAERVRFDVTGAGGETAVVLGELYARGDDWKVRAVGQGWEAGLAGLATDYGITVDDPATDDPEVVAVPSEHSGDAVAEVDPAGGSAFESAIAATPSLEVLDVEGDGGPGDGAADDLVVTVPVEDDAEAPEPAGPAAPSGAAEEPAAQETAVQEPAVRETAVQQTAAPQAASAPAPVATRGVRTRKKRATASALPAMTLRDGEDWQPARLFSVSSVGAGKEQEQRATAALLSTMTAVREFGRALLGRFGAPAGLIETYPEAPFQLGEASVRPDAVIRVARAGRIWTALLEVKTGTSQLRPDQIERYLDLARQQGYDAVVTLSNDLTPAGGAHPVGVDGRKLRKVALHHISWSEVLHEAQMQLAHRGVEDRLQAWLLAELIRYLTHPASGAAGFDDMGPGWVTVRNDLAAGVLTPRDRRIGGVISSWERLVRHLGLRLTSQLGVTVGQVFPRRLATDAAARIAAGTQQLAADGALSATLRVPGAAGTITVVADLRTSRVRTVVEVDAPGDGGAKGRVGWLLRKLADAPGSVTVEPLFARGGDKVCELLSLVRRTPAVLVPDPAVEIRGFRLTLLSPLGPKRNGRKGAFIPSVNAAVDTFYAQVVTPVSPAGVPKLPAEVADESRVAVETA